MPPARSAFDTRHDVDTDGEIPVGQLGMPADIAAQAERYMPTDERLLEVAVAFAGIEPTRFSFVDLGCGKGRALILAARLRFRRLIGVEIGPALAGIARANLARLGVAAEVHTGDAARFVFPPGPVVLFLFNPFKAATIGAVIEALRAARSPELVVIYHAPEHGKLLDASGFLTRLGSPRGWGRRGGVVVWRGTGKAHVRGGSTQGDCRLGCCSARRGSKMTLTIIVAAIITILVLGIGATITTVGAWYRSLRKPVWNPPEWVFGPAWAVILGLAAWAGVLAWTRAPDAGAQLRIGVLFGVNIVLHLLWTPLFFNLRRPDWALIEVAFLWLSVVALMVALAPLAPLAIWLLLPYLLWVAFAAFLNLTIVRMNPPFGSAA